MNTFFIYLLGALIVMLIVLGGLLQIFFRNVPLKKVVIGFYGFATQGNPEILIYGNHDGFEYFINECQKFKKELLQGSFPEDEHYHILPKNAPRLFEGRKIKTQSLIFWPSYKQEPNLKLVGLTSSLWPIGYYPYSFDIECTKDGIEDLCQKLRILIEDGNNPIPVTVDLMVSTPTMTDVPKKISIRLLLKE